VTAVLNAGQNKFVKRGAVIAWVATDAGDVPVAFAAVIVMV